VFCDSNVRRTKERERQNQRDGMNELEMVVERNGERRKYSTRKRMERE
jgi:hypothetical protein